MKNSYIFLILLIIFPVSAHSAIDMIAPSEIAAGAPVIIKLDGDMGKRDFITIVKAGRAEGEYANYQYVRSKNSIELRAPEDAGAYEIRYLESQPPYNTLARQKLTVAPVQASVQVPQQVEAGAQFEVTWDGPNNPQDFISLRDPQGNPSERKWISYVYTRKGSPVRMTAPDKPGTYEIRYQTGVKYYTLATANIIVAGASASVEAPKKVKAGERFKVKWNGPNNQQDYIAISAKNSDIRKYHHYQYTRKGSPVTLNAPDEAGEYEVRYQTGQSYKILASEPVIVEAVSASVEGPTEVVGGEHFNVKWEGPNNPGDFVAIMVSGSDKRASAKGGWAYVHYGSPAKLRAPLEPGDYEIRYQTGQSATILATQSLKVTPPPLLPGKLLVSIDPSSSAFAANDAVEIILDASGSMLKKQQGKRRIEIAREVLLDLTGEVIPAGTPFALRVFGHKEADSCRTDLEESLAPLDIARVHSKLKNIQAKNLAKTPIARSLELVAKDLKTVTGERVVVLVTDGEETCDGDPAAVIKALKASGVDVRINIVGFAINDEALKARFRYWADIGGGDYHDASSAEDLKRSMYSALQAPYDVLDASGQVVASGVIGDAGVELPPGTYSVQTRVKPIRKATANVVSEKRTGVVLK
jgi:hypothetical protein